MYCLFHNTRISEVLYSFIKVKIACLDLNSNFYLKLKNRFFEGIQV